MTIPVKNRIYSLDLLRGLVMIIMALDHTRDFFHFDAFLHDPLDIKTTSIPLYFTRWITHYCAPVFVFLAGTSIYLQSLRKTKEELSPFLFKRGAWLMFVEIIIVTFSWTFDFSFPVIVLGVIWAIGISMFLMGFLTRLPYFAVLVIGTLIAFGHNIFDSVESTHNGFWWDLLRNGNFAFHEIAPGHQVAIIYPFVPWLGLMMLGYCFGKIYEPGFEVAQRKKALRIAGLSLIALFVALRFLNSYGNPFRWEIQNEPIFTFLSFLNVHKYPPSFLYMCITIGSALIFLSIFESVNNKVTQIISVYGRVPFFYYILHFYILHNLCMLLFVMRGHAYNENTPDIFGIPFRGVIIGEGYSLTVVYIIWIAMVAALYPLCKWFSEYKKRNNYWWLSYL
jgi:uncharacterized membrane protein